MITYDLSVDFIYAVLNVFSFYNADPKSGFPKTPVTPEWRPYSVPTAF